MFKSLNELKKDYYFEEYDVPKDYDKFIQSINILKNDMIFQGTLIYAEGTAKNPDAIDKKIGKINLDIYSKRILKNDGKGTLRLVSKTYLKKGEDNYKIKIALIFSHNKYIQSYLFALPKDYVFVLDPNLTRKFIKQNKNLKEHDFIDDFQIFYLHDIFDFDHKFLEKIEYGRFLKRGSVILYRDKLTYNKFADRMNEIFNEKFFVFVEGLE